MIPGHKDLMSKRGYGGNLMPWAIGQNEITMGIWDDDTEET